MIKTGQVSFLHFIKRKRLLTFMKVLFRKQKTSSEPKEEVGPANNRQLISKYRTVSIRLNDYKYICISDILKSCNYRSWMGLSSVLL